MISTNSTPNKVGLLAGWGSYPAAVAAALRAQGYEIYCIGLKDHADERVLRPLCTDFRWLGFGKFGQAIAYYRGRGVRQAVMAGKFHKKLLYQPWVWLRHLPDGTAVRGFYHHFVTGKKDNKDDSLLGAAVDVFAAGGIEFLPATDFVPELLAVAGQYTRRGLSAAQQRDVEFGWQLAKAMGRLDVGQTVVVKDRAVIAVEAIEGTDACIRRAGELCPSGGFTVVKVAKPEQDMRFDVPTIGRGTLESLAGAGGRVLAIEADKTILLDMTQVIDYADRHQLVIVALREAEALRMAG